MLNVDNLYRFVHLTVCDYMSRVIREPTFCTCDKPLGADSCTLIYASGFRFLDSGIYMVSISLNATILLFTCLLGLYGVRIVKVCCLRPVKLQVVKEFVTFYRESTAK